MIFLWAGLALVATFLVGAIAGFYLRGLLEGKIAVEDRAELNRRHLPPGPYRTEDGKWHND